MAAQSSVVLARFSHKNGRTIMAELMEVLGHYLAIFKDSCSRRTERGAFLARDTSGGVSLRDFVLPLGMLSPVQVGRSSQPFPCNTPFYPKDLSVK